MDTNAVVIVFALIVLIVLIIIITTMRKKERFLVGQYGRFISLPYSHGVRRIRRECNDNCITGDWMYIYRTNRTINL